MQVRLRITHTQQIDNQWKDEVEKSLGLTEVLTQAHVEREEIYFFDAANRADADAIKARIGNWQARLPIDKLVDEGWVQYSVEFVGEATAA